MEAQGVSQVRALRAITRAVKHKQVTLAPDGWHQLTRRPDAW